MHAERDSGRRGLKPRAAAWLTVGVAASMLAGCTVFATDEPAPQMIQTEADESQFPAVGEVPDEAPATTSPDEREEIVDELENDQATGADPAAIQTNSLDTPTVDPMPSASLAPDPLSMPADAGVMQVAAVGPMEADTDELISTGDAGNRRAVISLTY